MDDDKRFFMTYARSRPNEIVPWAEKHDVPLLTNAIHRWSEAQEDFLDMWEYDTPHVIDAGGYNVMASYVTQHGNLRSEIEPLNVRTQLDTEEPFYPYSVQQYHDWLMNHTEEFEWATVMDYACETRFDELWSYEERIDKTFETTVRQYNLLEDEGHPYKLLPVLQGREIDEYVEFYERLEDHGIPVDHIGLGTVCRLSSEKRIAKFENEIRERTGVDRIHGFGVKVNAFQYGANFDSADSQAWVYKPSNGALVLDDGDRLREIKCDDSRTRTVESFKNYYAYVTRLQQGESAVDYDSGVTADHTDDEAREVLVT
jgi:hypothetical protein